MKIDFLNSNSNNNNNSQQVAHIIKTKANIYLLIQSVTEPSSILGIFYVLTYFTFKLYVIYLLLFSCLAHILGFFAQGHQSFSQHAAEPESEPGDRTSNKNKSQHIVREQLHATFLNVLKIFMLIWEKLKITEKTRSIFGKDISNYWSKYLKKQVKKRNNIHLYASCTAKLSSIVLLKGLPMYGILQ